MTPDTAALRALVDTYVTGWYLTAAEVRALCDAADEVERLTSKYEEWDSMHSSCIALREDLARRDAEVAVLNESIGRHARDLDGAGESLRRVTAERDASRTAHAALVADLRALHRTDLTDTGERPGRWVVIDADDLDALLDRHAPTTGETP